MEPVTVNGEARELPPSSTMAELLARLNVSGRYAVEVNEVILPRSRYTAYQVQPGDRIEIVRAIGGG